MILDPKQILVAEKLQQLATILEKQASAGFFKNVMLSLRAVMRSAKLVMLSLRFVMLSPILVMLSLSKHAPFDKLRVTFSRLRVTTLRLSMTKSGLRVTPSKSLYIHGDVGRGKSMLMRNFFNSLAKTPKDEGKIYFHFNAFVKAIHEALRNIRQEKKNCKDELIEAVKRVVKKNRLLCLDEFQVLDIADAMLLSRIFSYLFAQGVLVVFTSNAAPHQLYKNGLQREVFLEFVEKILLKNCEILHLDSPTDYRLLCLSGLARRHFISNQKNRAEIKKIIWQLTDGKKPKSLKLLVWGREIKIRKTFDLKSSVMLTLRQAQGDGPSHAEPVEAWDHEASNKKIAIFNFDELCRVDFSAADYSAICQNFDLMFLLRLPQLTSEDQNEARRLTLFIDEIYENKVALILLAKTKPEKIYQSGIGAEAFQRTVSRLNEIKSDQYWANSKFAAHPSTSPFDKLRVTIRCHAEPVEA